MHSYAKRQYSLKGWVLEEVRAAWLWSGGDIQVTRITIIISVQLQPKMLNTLTFFFFFFLQKLSAGRLS